MGRYLSCLVALCLLAFAGTSALNALPRGKPLRMGSVGFAKEATYRSHRHLRDHLRRRLGRLILIKPFKKYDDVVRALVRDEIEVAMLSPLVYLKAMRARRLHPLAYSIFRSSGYYTYRAAIIVRRDAPHRTLAELARRPVAFVSRSSTSGYKLPRHALTKAGLVGEKDVKAQFYGNHIDTVLAVVNGKADAAATFDDIFEAFETLGKHRLKCRRLWLSSFVIPSDVFVATRRVPVGLRRKMRAALLSYFGDQHDKRVPRNEIYEGFVPADPNLYDELREFLYESRER